MTKKETRILYRRAFRFLKEKGVFIEWTDNRRKWISRFSPENREKLMIECMDLPISSLKQFLSYGFAAMSLSDEGYSYWHNIYNTAESYEKYEM